MLYQNDPEWKDEPLNNSSETIGTVGCLLTALCNVNNKLNRLFITPIDLNRELIKYSGYTNDNYIIWAIVEHILGLDIVHHYKDDVEYSVNDNFIVNYINQGCGHFTNLVSKHGSCYTVFDVWSNKIQNKTDIRRVVKICKKGLL